MNKTILLVGLSVLSAAALPALAQAPDLPGWKLVWSDEFNYTDI